MLYPAVETSGTTTVNLVCAPSASGAVTVSFGMPFPRGFVSDATRVRIETPAGAEVPSDASELARWRHFSNVNLDGQSIRSVLMSFSHNCTSASTASYVVRWGSARTQAANTGVTPANVASLTWGAQAAPAAGEHPQTDNYAIDASAAPVREPRAWVALPAAWLMKQNLRGPVSTQSSAARNNTLGFLRTYVNDVASDVTQYESADNGQGLINWSSEVEGWLYDRPATLWNAYVQTGDVKWLRHAHRASQFYGSHIASSGQRGSFAKKPGDAKYSLNGGLFADYLLTGDARLLDKIRAVAELVGTVGTRLPPYSQTGGLWTERHTGVALAGALYAYEATGEAGFKTRVQQIVSGMNADVTTPPAGYPSASAMAGVLLHRPEVHEGDSYPDVIMSPWMSALMMESMWHYHVLSDDVVALNFLSNYAQFVAQRSITQEGANWSPWYLTGLSGNYYGAEAEHAHDVMGMLARGRWARAQLGLSTATIDTQITRLRTTADATFAGWIRSSSGLPRYRLTPTRKAGWWFGSTYDLAWLGVQ